MTDQEFKREITRHIGGIIIACIRRYGGTWMDYVPASVRECVFYTVSEDEAGRVSIETRTVDI